MTMRATTLLNYVIPQVESHVMSTRTTEEFHQLGRSRDFWHTIPSNHLGKKLANFFLFIEIQKGRKNSMVCHIITTKPFTPHLIHQFQSILNTACLTETTNQSIVGRGIRLKTIHCYFYKHLAGPFHIADNT
eukprot:Gb_12871 [translate_table: standard]